MGADWETCALGDLIAIKHGFAFQGEFFNDNAVGNILLTPGNFAVGGGFKGDKFKYYSGPVPADFVLEEGDLLVTMTDLSKEADTLGYPAFVPARPDNRRYLHNQRLGKIRVRDTNKLDLRYLHYLLRSPEYRHEVLAGATGTTVRHTSPARILAYRFPCPSLVEQRAIAYILGTLDDKIELNRRMSETLEAMARALFKSWFVDFDPVRAKAENRDTGLPREIADIFPSRFVDSELGEIPEGWGVKPFSETVEAIGGGTPKTSVPEFWGGDIPWFSVVDAPRLSEIWAVDTEKRVTQQGVENSSTKILAVGTTIISARGTVGRLALVGEPMAMNQSCYGLRCRLGENGFYNYYSTRRVVASLVQRAHGSVFNTITRSTLASVHVVTPPTSLVAKYEHYAGRWMWKVRQNIKECSNLSYIRDALLPGLISGQVRVATRNFKAKATI